MYVVREEEHYLHDTPGQSPWEIGFDLTDDRGRVYCFQNRMQYYVPNSDEVRKKEFIVLRRQLLSAQSLAELSCTPRKVSEDELLDCFCRCADAIVLVGAEKFWKEHNTSVSFWENFYGTTRNPIIKQKFFDFYEMMSK